MTQFYLNLEHHFNQHGLQNPLARAVRLVSLVLEYIYFTPQRALRTHLAGLCDILQLTHTPSTIINSLPKDPRSSSSWFNLDPVTRQYISCTTCHCLYPYNPNSNHDTSSNCANKNTPASDLCDTELWKSVDLGLYGQCRYVPKQKYLHQDLKSWVGRMLSRKGIEDMLKSRQYDGSSQAMDPDAPIDDIWSSKVFCDLKDASGNPFMMPPLDEGRLVFSLSMDGFNPFHNKAAGQSATATGIWLVLLNLPVHLRYLQENMYVAGVIAGKPSEDEIIHYLQLVVDDLLEFWNPGVHFSRTYNYPYGIIYKGMLVPVICDMLAARQAIGQAASPLAHYFCTFCDLDIDDIDILDRSEWPSKDITHIRHYAGLWKEAASEKDQKMLFQASGLRWSPLLQLSYWNPILFTIIDSMHTLDLNLFQNHCRVLFQIDLLHNGGDGSFIEPKPLSTKCIGPGDRKELLSSLARCRLLIVDNPEDLLPQLLQYPRKVLYTYCVEEEIMQSGKTLVLGTRWRLAKNIEQWANIFVFLYLSLIDLAFYIASAKK